MEIRNVLSATRRPALVALLAVLPVLSCEEAVVTPIATTMQISPATATLTALGQTTQFAAVILDQNGQTMTGEPVIWSTGNGAVAGVDANGLVTAVSVGITTVTAQAGTANATAPVTVEQRVTAVAVTPTDATLEEDEQLQMLASATDANGRPVADPRFQWTSSRSAVAVVNPQGLVTARSPGDTRISATSGGVIGSASVTVEDAGVATVTVTPATATVRIGATVQLAAEGRDSDGVVMPGLVPTWSSSSTTVATVSSTGLVTARAAGTATVTATVEDKTASAIITVPNLPADDHGSSFATATTIAYGSAVTGRLDAGDEDFFKIVVSSSVKSVRLTAWAEGSLDTQGQLYNDKEAVLDDDDDDGPGRNFQVKRTVSSGTYYVKVKGYRDTTAGAYTIKVDDHGDSSGSATSVSKGNTSGEIGVRGNADYFHFNVTSTGDVTLTTTGTTDTVGDLFNSSGDSIAGNDDKPDKTTGDDNFLITHRVTAGNYYLRVTGYDGTSTGSYVLNVSGDATLSSVSTDNTDGNSGTGPNNSNNTRQTAHYMELGHVASDAIGSSEQEDWFSVYVRNSVSTQPTIRMTAWTTGGARVSMFLKDDENKVLAAHNPPVSAPPNVQVVLDNTAKNTWYYITVRGRSENDRGGYQIKVDDHGDSRATATDVGSSSSVNVKGTLVAAGNVDYFKFTVANDDTNVTISTTGSVNTYGELQNSNGARIAWNDDESKTEDNFKIIRTNDGTNDKSLDEGTYYVKVSGESGSTGDYELVIS